MPSTPTLSLQLHRDAHGRLVLTLPDGTVHAGVLPVRAFPIAAPGEGLSLMGADGHELVWLDRMDQLPEPARGLVLEELAVREFVPAIQKILGVSSFSTPSTWTVETDRGGTQFTLKAEEDIRRLHGRTSLLIASGEGVQYAIPDSTALDKASRRLLERFL